ncbi:MAG TPA: polyribonucleotide nucleotidyltransferase [Polyangiaceae bacterium]|nr:polyribonucleotide nucleotidyltransferase [Polyangiaceae bacterium]
MFVRESVTINGQPLTIETGRLAKQAHGAVLVTYGGSVVLVTAVSTEERPGLDFFPMTCEYFEKTYAAGKIPGGFFKREGRQRDTEILTCRLMDRPMRPLFPEGYKKDTQIIATVMSSDQENPTDVMAMIGASAAVHISDIPFDGPCVGIRVCRVEGELVVYPTLAQIAKADIELTMGVTKDAIVMVEGGSNQVSEKELIDAMMFGHEQAQPVLGLIEKLRAAVGKPKREFSVKKLDDKIASRVAQIVDADVAKACVVKEKKARYTAYSEVRSKLSQTLSQELGDAWVDSEKLAMAEFEERKYHVVRNLVLDSGKRIDGRDSKTIRPISSEVGLLPRTHGSALFQRGETQAIVVTTLGTAMDEQKIDGLTGESWKQFMLHYNFPPFCTGETKPMRGPARREIGHGALAERALARVIPDHETFPYTIRVVSETLESNGSSSMASVCGGTLCMMDCGVPLKAPVAGIAMGLIKEGDRLAILSDILGDEDHLGDMDFKVCGTKNGVTAIQMDIKIKGLDRAIMERALEQAREGRLHILDRMLSTLAQPREELSRWAPRITTIQVKPDQIRIVIGSGGKTIKGIIEQTGCSINIEDDGTVAIASADSEAVLKAVKIIEGLLEEPEVGKTYKGIVRRVVDFGAFVEILPNTEALLHVSEIAYERTENVADVLNEGDEIEVKVLSVERDGKIRLSRKALLPVPEGYVPAPPQERGRGFGGGGGGGGRDRGRGRDRDRPRPR